jgi:hypothetical protein
MSEVRGKMSVTPHGALRTLIVEVGQALTGGLWVGGTATLDSTTLEFHPSTLDRRLVKGNLDVVIPLDQVRSVTVERRISLDLVVVQAVGVALRFRCFRAGEFAAAIRSASTPMP